MQVQEINVFRLRVPFGCDRVCEPAGRESKGGAFGRLDRAPVERHGPAVAEAFGGGHFVEAFGSGICHPPRLRRSGSRAKP